MAHRNRANPDEHIRAVNDRLAQREMTDSHNSSSATWTLTAALQSYTEAGRSRHENSRLFCPSANVLCHQTLHQPRLTQNPTAKICLSRENVEPDPFVLHRENA